MLSKETPTPRWCSAHHHHHHYQLHGQLDLLLLLLLMCNARRILEKRKLSRSAPVRSGPVRSLKS